MEGGRTRGRLFYSRGGADRFLVQVDSCRGLVTSIRAGRTAEELDVGVRERAIKVGRISTLIEGTEPG